MDQTSPDPRSSPFKESRIKYTCQQTMINFFPLVKRCRQFCNENYLLPRRAWRSMTSCSSASSRSPRFKSGRRQLVHRRRQLLPQRRRPASLGTALQQQWPQVRMKVTSFLSSSAVQGPFLTPSLSQQGCLPITTKTPKVEGFK